MTNITPLILYGNKKWVPNPVKVMLVLAVLDIPYEVVNIDWDEAENPAFVVINPNSRIPALTDPNNSISGGFTIWESGAIIEYLVDRYDKNNKISFETGSDDYYRAKQWLHFQVNRRLNCFVFLRLWV